MTMLAQQVYELLSGLWHYGGSMAQLASVTNTTELEVAVALSQFHQQLDYRIESSDVGVPRPGITIVWFLKSEMSEACL